MKPPLRTALFLILQLQVLCTASPPRKPFSEYYPKFVETLTARSFGVAVQDAATVQKQVGRVVYPIGYGADPTGAQDSTEAITSAFSDAFNVQHGLELLPGVNDLGGVVVDFQGGNYIISQPIRLPASGGGNVVIQGGTVRGSQTFPGDRNLIEVAPPNTIKMGETEDINPSNFHMIKASSNEILFEDITFRDLLFDSSYRGGGIFISNSARIRIDNCFFLHFTTQGILVQGGHETFISNTFLGQHSTVGGDPGEKYFSGTGIDLASNDNVISNVVIFSAATGIIIRGQSNLIIGVHCYNKATSFGGVGIYVKLPGLSQTRIDSCYLDFNSIALEDPVQVHITNTFFLGDGNVVLKSVQGRISGLNIVDNMFAGTWRSIVELEGEFTDINQVVVDRNNVNGGMVLKSTVGKLGVVGNGTKWVLDFSNVLVFPNKISHLQYSIYVQGQPGAAGFPVLAVTNVANNVVTVESDKAVDGVVYATVDQ